MFVAAAVAQPYIVTFIGQHEPRCLIFIVDDPGVRAVEESMLQEEGFKSLLDLCSFLLDAKEGEDVAVLSDDLVGLHWVVVVFAVIGEVEF